MRLSICIVNWNTSDLLAECLRSIQHVGADPRVCPSTEATEQPRVCPSSDVEVIVVDNASADFDEEKFRREFPDALFIRSEQNEGYAHGNNQAIARSSGEYILLLNPDTVVREGTLEALVRFMDEHPEAGAAGCKLIKPDGTIDPSCRAFPTPMAVAFEYLGLSKLFPKNKLFARYRMTWFNYDEIIEIDQPMASSLIIRRAALDNVGLFDEEFPIFFNDVDWCRRAKNAGWRIYFTPTAVVTHYGGASTKQIRLQMIEESHRSLVRYYDKHYAGLANLPARLMVRAGAWLNLRLLRQYGRELRG